MENGPHIECELIEWGSVKYIQSLALRHEVLRKPLGMIFDPAIFPEEKGDIHLVANHGDWLVGCMILTEAGNDLKMRQVAVANKYRFAIEHRIWFSAFKFGNLTLRKAA